MAGEKKQIHVFYTGKVQGVGFRFTAQDFARELGIKGWVKNLHGGQVEVVAQADEDTLKLFLGKVNHHFARSILGVDVAWSEPSNECDSFEIRF